MAHRHRAHDGPSGILEPAVREPTSSGSGPGTTAATPAAGRTPRASRSPVCQDLLGAPHRTTAASGRAPHGARLRACLHRPIAAATARRSAIGSADGGRHTASVTSPATSGTSLPVEGQTRERGSLLALLGWAGFAAAGALRGPDRRQLDRHLLAGAVRVREPGHRRHRPCDLAGRGATAPRVATERRPSGRPSSCRWRPSACRSCSLASHAWGWSTSRGRSCSTALYLLLVRIMALPYARARIGGLMAALALVLGLAYVGWTVVLWVEWWGLVGELRLPPFRPTQLGLTWGSASVAAHRAGPDDGRGGRRPGIRDARRPHHGQRPRRPDRGCRHHLGQPLRLAVARRARRSSSAALAAARLARSRTCCTGPAEPAGRGSPWCPWPSSVVVAAVVFGPAMIDRLVERWRWRSSHLLGHGAAHVRGAPVLGQGPGTWMVRRVGLHASPASWTSTCRTRTASTSRPRPSWAWSGLAAGLVAFGCRGVAARAGAARRETASRRRWAWASVFGLVYLALNVVVDVHTIVTVPLLLGIPIAVLDATSERGIGVPPVLRPWARPRAPSPWPRWSSAAWPPSCSSRGRSRWPSRTSVPSPP